MDIGQVDVNATTESTEDRCVVERDGVQIDIVQGDVDATRLVVAGRLIPEFHALKDDPVQHQIGEDDVDADSTDTRNRGVVKND